VPRGDSPSAIAARPAAHTERKSACPAASTGLLGLSEDPGSSHKVRQLDAKLNRAIAADSFSDLG